MAASVREMREFESFVLRMHDLQIRWFGPRRIALMRQGEVDMECSIRKAGNKVHLSVHGSEDHKGSRLRRFLQLFRFHITASDPKRSGRCLDAFMNREGECKRNRCFQYLRDAFPEEWLHFNGHMPLVGTFASSATKETILKDAVAGPAQPVAPIIVNANTSSGGDGGDRIAGAVERLIAMLAEPAQLHGASYGDSMNGLLDAFQTFSKGMQNVLDEGTASPQFLKCCEDDALQPLQSAT